LTAARMRALFIACVCFLQRNTYSDVCVQCALMVSVSCRGIQRATAAGGGADERDGARKRKRERERERDREEREREREREVQCAALVSVSCRGILRKSRGKRRDGRTMRSATYSSCLGPLDSACAYARSHVSSSHACITCCIRMLSRQHTRPLKSAYACSVTSALHTLTSASAYAASHVSSLSQVISPAHSCQRCYNCRDNKKNKGNIKIQKMVFACWGLDALREHVRTPVRSFSTLVGGGEGVYALGGTVMLGCTYMCGRERGGKCAVGQSASEWERACATTQTQTDRQTERQTDRQTDTHTRTHARTHARARTHTHTHTHTQTQTHPQQNATCCGNV
jgi:hypothetical protein